MSRVRVVRQLILTFPFYFAAGAYAEFNACNEDYWVETLQKYEKSERSYNKAAENYNQTLSFHTQKPLIHQKMAFDDLVYMWSPRYQAIHPSLNEQVNFARAQSLIFEKVALEAEKEKRDLASLLSRWSIIIEHCIEQRKLTNAQHGKNYKEQTRSLLSDIKQLQKKQLTLSKLYQQEMSLIERSRLTYDQNKRRQKLSEHPASN
ncbi:hypothetical protein [Vibrio maerlii]|uniref:hypothetical protein n=1 Tax=Vibrio maerlii TaxID=2231648 RepID=UPI000F513E9F|nr:hypothetical protein [Vibrio maerlii]